MVHIPSLSDQHRTLATHLHHTPLSGGVGPAQDSLSSSLGVRLACHLNSLLLQGPHARCSRWRQGSSLWTVTGSCIHASRQMLGVQQYLAGGSLPARTRCCAAPSCTGTLAGGLCQPELHCPPAAAGVQCCDRCCNTRLTRALWTAVLYTHLCHEHDVREVQECVQGMAPAASLHGEGTRPCRPTQQTAHADADAWPAGCCCHNTTKANGGTL